MLKPFPLLAVSALSLTTLTACIDSGSDDSDNQAATLQFYNASANSADVSVELDGNMVISDIEFADISTNYSITEDNYELVLSANDQQGEQMDLMERDIALDDRDHRLLILAGDFNAPQLIDFSYRIPEFDDDLDDDDKVMEFYLANLANTDTTYELHLAEEDAGFDQATSYGALTFGTFSDTQSLKLGSYVLYLTDPDNDNKLVFESQPIDMEFENTYVLVLRDNFGPANPKLTVDRLTTSTTVLSYPDITAVAEYRIYNGLPTGESLQVELEGADDLSLDHQLDAGQITGFNEVPFGDFKLSASDSDDQLLLNNLLLTLNQNESKTILLYPLDDGGHGAMTVEQQLRPRLYEHQMSIANITSDYDDVDIYFVREDETIESAHYKLTDVDFEDVDTLMLPTDAYQINVVHEDDNDTLTLLYQSSPMSLSSSNYMLILQRDDSQPQGYRLTTIE